MIYLEIWTLASTLSFWLYIVDDDMQLPLFSSTYFWAISIGDLYYTFESLGVIRQNFLGVHNERLHVQLVHLHVLLVDDLYFGTVVTYMGTTMTWKFYLVLAHGVSDPSFNLDLQ